MCVDGGDVKKWEEERISGWKVWETAENGCRFLSFSSDPAILIPCQLTVLLPFSCRVNTHSHTAPHHHILPHCVTVASICVFLSYLQNKVIRSRTRFISSLSPHHMTIRIFFYRFLFFFKKKSPSEGTRSHPKLLCKINKKQTIQKETKHTKRNNKKRPIVRNRKIFIYCANFAS